MKNLIFFSLIALIFASCSGNKRLFSYKKKKDIFCRGGMEIPVKKFECTDTVYSLRGKIKTVGALIDRDGDGKYDIRVEIEKNLLGGLEKNTIPFFIQTDMFLKPKEIKTPFPQKCMYWAASFRPGDGSSSSRKKR